MKPAEKRSSIRVAVQLPVTLHAEDGREFSGVVEDISLGGASIRCDNPPPPGTSLKLALHFSGLRSALGAAIDVDRIADGALIEANEIAEIRWAAGQKKFGIRFKGLSRKTKKFLAELIDIFEEIRETGL